MKPSKSHVYKTLQRNVLAPRNYVNVVIDCAKRKPVPRRQRSLFTCINQPSRADLSLINNATVTRETQEHFCPGRSTTEYLSTRLMTQKSTYL